MTPLASQREAASDQKHLIIGLAAISSSGAFRATPPSNHVLNLGISMMLRHDDVLDLSVSNPNDFKMCTSYADWPGPKEIGGPGDVFRVVGPDGKEWGYVGMEADTVGYPQVLQIAPHGEVSAPGILIRKNYAPAGSDRRINKIYFRARFYRC